MSQQTSSISVSRAQIVEKAWSLMGLPFRFYGRARERGLDCVGVVIVTGWELGLLPADCKIPDYPFPPSKEMFTVFDDYMDEKEGAAEGRVAVWAHEGQPRHVGILTFKDRWRCIGIDWSASRRRVTCYTAADYTVWKYYDYRGIE